MLNRKVLIIDDETDLCLLLGDYFTRKKYEVAITHTLLDGKKMLHAFMPDVLVLDNNLPDGMGWDEAPVFATDFPDMYIVLMSAFHPTTPPMPFAEGFRVIEKPVSMAGLDQQFSEL